VRPDWTGAEAIFGYEDGLRPAVQGRAAWAVTGILDFILKADKDKQHPYLLVLDEMNLAHVERYFADVLSGMESRQECLPHITREADGCWRVASSRRIQLPKNLWIIGTVNVDETTYMFSPKVLDRANVFEFRVASADLRPGASKPHTCTPGDAALIRGLHAIANDDRYHKQAPAEVVDPIAAHLRRLHELLSRYGLEFGHRTFYEGLRFASLMSISGAKSPDRILDRIVVQKLLPRLHGSRRRLEVPLLALAQFARDLPEQLPGDDKLGAMQPDQVSDGSSPRLVSSYDKIVRMLRSLRANQFASFTE
jgi:5-methylcytosine-specific restriction protein B